MLKTSVIALVSRPIQLLPAPLLFALCRSSSLWVNGLFITKLTMGNLLAHVIHRIVYDQTIWRKGCSWSLGTMESSNSDTIRYLLVSSLCFKFHSFSQLSGLVNMVGNARNYQISHLIFSNPREDLRIFFLHFTLNTQNACLDLDTKSSLQGQDSFSVDKKGLSQEKRVCVCVYLSVFHIPYSNFLPVLVHL